MFEQRLTHRLQTHWDNTRKEAAMPEFSRFNVGPIEDLWQQCMLFVVQPSMPDQPPVVNFYKVGEGLRKMYGSDMTGQTVNTTQRHFQGAKIVARISDVIADPKAIIDEGQFVNAKSKMVKYRSCLLPFGREGKVTHVVAGISWREF